MNKNGFTFMEVLVVVLIMGVLAAIALPQYQKAVMRARFSQLKPLVSAFKDAEEEFYLIYRYYTGNINALGIKFSGFTPGWTTGANCDPSPNVHNGESCGYYVSKNYMLDTQATGAEHGRAVYGDLSLNGKKKMRFTIYLDNAPVYGVGAPGAATCGSFEGPGSVPYELCKSETGKSGHEGTITFGNNATIYLFKYQ